jgi:N-formylglutamate amidohydrolase
MDGTTELQPPFAFVGEDIDVPVVVTAIHGGHELRPEVARLTALPAEVRAREEDLHTDRIASGAPAQVVAHRSRFEVDLNRPRERAVYRGPDDAWGHEPWDGPLPEAVVDGSLALYDAFYDALATRLDRLAPLGPFAVIDVHSYNHRRGGPTAAPEPVAENPEVNLGTGSLDHERWEPVVTGLARHFAGLEVAGHALDVRENVRFAGAHLAKWVNERYEGRGCAVAVEFKKVFMDEWSGTVDEAHLARLREAVATAVVPIADQLART